MARSYKIHKSYHTSHHNTTKNHPKNSTSLQASSNAATLSTSRQTTNNLSLSSQPSSTVRDLQQKSGCRRFAWSYLAAEVTCGKVFCGYRPKNKAHLSEPGTHQRTWRVMGRPARQKTQTLSLTRRNDRTRHDHAAAPLADCPFVPPSIHPSHPHKKRAPRPNTRELCYY